MTRPRLTAGNYKVSIQAGEHLYSTPREDLPNLEDYSEWEIAIFKEGNWVQPAKDPAFKNFPQLEGLLNRYQSGDSAVGAYIPKQLVKDLVAYLKEK